MRTLVIAPHLDDEALSTGALILARVKSIAQVFVLVMHGRKYGYVEAFGKALADEVMDFERAKAVLGYQHDRFVALEEGEPGRVGYCKHLHVIEQTLADFKPTEVVVPSPHDLNQDHRHLSDVCRIALRPANLGSVTRILEARAFDGQLRDASYYVPFDQTDMDRILDAIAQYRREGRTGNHPRSPENIVAHRRIMGSRCGARYAEGYDVRLIVETGSCGWSSPEAAGSSAPT